MQTVQPIVGIFGLLALTFAASENRRAVSFRQAAIGLGLTVVLAALFIKIPGGHGGPKLHGVGTALVPPCPRSRPHR